jgi:hypothetical protein
MSDWCVKIFSIFIFFAAYDYQWRSWRARSRGTGRRRRGGGHHWRHPQVHRGVSPSRVAMLLLIALLPGPKCLWGYLHPHSLFGSAYIAMHFCFQVCCWVMNEWRVAINLNSGLLKGGILLPVTCWLTLELLLTLSIPSCNTKENLESDQGVRFL